MWVLLAVEARSCAGELEVRLQLGRQLVGCRAPLHSLGAGRRQKAAGTFGGAANCYTSKGRYPATSKQLGNLYAEVAAPMHVAVAMAIMFSVTGVMASGSVPLCDTVTVSSEHDGTACNVDVVHLLVYNPIVS